MSDMKTFLKGFTIFHVMGILMMVAGVLLPNIGNDLKWGNLEFSGNLLQLAGVVSYFIEWAKGWRKK